MSYNNSHVEPRLKTAGKITILTTLFGVVGFLFIFLLNVGQTEFQSAQAQANTATTSVNVLNTPPEFNLGQEPQEEFESSATTPTNSGDTVSFIGTATDQNGAPYFMLLCDTGTTPIASASTLVGGLGTAPPTCGDGIGAQIAVSTSTVSGQQARVSTTTVDGAGETFPWFAWACDDDPDNPECTSIAYQGSGTTSSPYEVNNRPLFSGISNDGPVDPDGLLTYTAVSSDPDTSGTADTVKLTVCTTAGFDTSTDTCTGGTISSSTFAASDPAALFQLIAPTQDATYDGFVYVTDSHGHESAGTAHNTNSSYIVRNVAPTVDSSFIFLNDGDPIALDTALGETASITLSFVANDRNSCENNTNTAEIVDYVASVYRSGIGSTTCDRTATNYNPNNCYPSEVGLSTWNISCSATTTGSGACTGAADSNETWYCEFPLWFVADPTSGTAADSFFDTEDWRAAVSSIDDNGATSTLFAESATGVELLPLLAFELNENAIPYGDLAPGDNTTFLRATTTFRATGNTGIDTSMEGVRMCPDSYIGAPGTCPAAATSSIAEGNQAYGTSTAVTWGTTTTATRNILTTTPAELEINIPKTQSTTTPQALPAYWGIGIPGTVTLAGVYTGLNTFTVVSSEPSEWGN